MDENEQRQQGLIYFRVRVLFHRGSGNDLHCPEQWITGKGIYQSDRKPWSCRYGDREGDLFHSSVFSDHVFGETGQLSLRSYPRDSCGYGDDDYMEECSGYYGVFGMMVDLLSGAKQPCRLFHFIFNNQ